MSEIGCVVAVGDAPRQQIGSCTALEWALNSLDAVRGLDELVCVTSKENQDFVRRVCDRSFDRETTVSLAPAEAMIALPAWACDEGPLRGHKNVVWWRPTSPLVRPGSLEKCFSVVATGKSPAAAPAVSTRLSYLDSAGKRTCRDLLLIVPDVIAVKTSLLKTVNDVEKLAPTLIEIERTESIEITSRAGLLLARAIVDSGLV